MSLPTDSDNLDRSLSPDLVTGELERLEQTLEASWSGPLPPPAALEAFDRIVPGMAEALMKNHLEECAHQRAVISALVAQRGKQSLLASQGGILCFVVVCGLAAYALSRGETTLALIAVVIAASIAGAAPLLNFLLNRNRVPPES